MAEAIRWLGEQNCPQVFAFLGLEHGAGPDDTDHSVIRGRGPDGAGGGAQGSRGAVA